MSGILDFDAAVFFAKEKAKRDHSTVCVIHWKDENRIILVSTQREWRKDVVVLEATEEDRRY